MLDSLEKLHDEVGKTVVELPQKGVGLACQLDSLPASVSEEKSDIARPDPKHIANTLCPQFSKMRKWDVSPIFPIKKLQIEVLQGSGDKTRDLADYCLSQGIDLGKVLYVGNDVNDLDAMQLVGYRVAPADAHPQVLAIARYVTQARGGEGVIKELSEWLLA